MSLNVRARVLDLQTIVMPTSRTQPLEIQESTPTESLPGSLSTLLYLLRLTFLRVILHSLTVVCLTARLYALPLVYGYNKLAIRATPVTRIVRNVYRLYRILYTQPRTLHLDDPPEDAPGTRSIELTQINTPDYHNMFPETARNISITERLHDEIFDKTRELTRRDVPAKQVSLVPRCAELVADDATEAGNCPECVDERQECPPCVQGRRVSSVTSRLPRRTRSDGCFQRPADKLVTWEPQKQTAKKKSGKLQKKKSSFMTGNSGLGAVQWTV